MTVQVQWWHDVDGGHWDSEDSVYLSAGQVAYTLGDLSAGKYRIVVFPSGTAYSRAYSSAFMVADGQAVTGMKAAKNSTPINWMGSTSARANPMPVVAHPRAKTVIR